MSNYDQLRIHSFISECVDLGNFCFFVDNKLGHKRYTHRSLRGDIPSERSRDLVQRAEKNEELGEIVYLLFQYWLEWAKGSPRVLLTAGLDEDLAVFVQELLDWNEPERASQVSNLLKKVGANQVITIAPPPHEGGYNVAAIRKLVLKAFTPLGLRTFCKDRPLYRPVVNLVAAKPSLEEFADELITYCEKQALFPELLEAIKGVNPRQLERHSPYTL